MDRDVHPGERYTYRLTAMDRTSPANESGYSEVAAILVALDPDSPEAAEQD